MSFVATLSGTTDAMYSGVIVWGYIERVPSRHYGAPEPIVFEGKWYSGPANAKAILEVIYGDYLTLPPHEQRSAHHRFDAYLVE